MSIATGTKLGQYEVQDFIGQGAMGLVFRAYHVQLERSGAVKVLQALSPDADTTARFRHEAQAIAQMRHPNIVNVYDFGEFQGTPFMIVEYVPGGSLADSLSKGPMQQAEALKFLRGIAAGLDYAHGLGIVHRDVKPANVLLEKDDTPVLADFGLAKLLQGSSLKSMTGVTTGTPAYMAPEQVMGHMVGPAADRYSLACIAYEMLTGVIPFDGEGLMELLYAQVHREPSPPSARDASLGPQVDAVIMRGLAKDPAARWESCTAFVEALASALASKPVAAAVVNGVAAASVAEKTIALPATRTMPRPPVVRGGTPAANSGATHPRSARFRRRLLEITGAVVLALVLLLTLGICAAAQKPALTVSPTRVTFGESVIVTATHVPAKKAGEIQLLSQVYRFPFRASSSGNVSEQIAVPADIELGHHTVRLCWDSSCPVQAALEVVAPGAGLETPVASSTATPPAGSSPTPRQSPKGTPTPGASPSATARPGSSPTATPTHAPSPTPRSSPIPSPAPSPKPTPTPTPSPSITLVSISSLGSTSVTFHYFYAGSATVTIHQGATTRSVTVTVTPGTSTTVSFKTPTGFALTALPLIPQAYVTVGSLTSNSVNVTL